MGVIIVLIGMLLSVNLSIALDELPCHFLDSINITDGNRLANDDSIEFNGLVYSRKQYAEINYVLLRDGTDQITVDPYIRGCICNIKPCVRLCCPLGTLNTDDTDITVCQDHDKGNKFEAEVIHKNNETKVIPLERFFAYIEGIPCNFVYFDDDYQITHKGEISRGNLSTKLTHQNSCLHAGLNAETNEVDLRLLTCIELEGDDYDLNQYHVIRHQIINFCMLISVVFIVATLLAYIFIPKLRNLQTNCLICYLICLAISYSLVIFVTSFGYPSFACIPFGYFLAFSFFSAFFWLNVFNFDFWVDFQSKHRFKQMSERKKFYLYLVYGFGGPCLLILFIYILDNTVQLPPNMRPGIRDGACFISS
ncbi:probable G-protein coupled receptor Mth-like 10 isoform X3 [Sitodiplosis mosellana]|uniref:probable G-protein coupled receptor Mth-like 10 isoform X3 n=1 Tax=Sitodiplosis mosellana TaxID=263140 RepID=UPI002444AA79|nr:probable G-protein coupled receptor Mth-like 10 isoform X3 [Sitodiplosis mosellana]